MKKGILTICILVFTGIIFLATGPLSAADVGDKIVIENKGYKKDKRGPVPLSHKKHSVDYKIACNECHHEYKDGKNVWTEKDPVKKCAECHNPTRTEGKAKKLQTAFHKNCKDCHKAAGKGEKKAPFKKCKGCHSK